jgi:hypothetical protein
LTLSVWREIGSEEPQPVAAFIEALSQLVGRWLLVRSADISLMRPLYCAGLRTVGGFAAAGKGRGEKEALKSTKRCELGKQGKELRKE